MRVGVFDSGIGGLTVLRRLIEKYPLNDYIYYGDTLNLPYGEKDKDTLFNLSSNIVDFLISKNVDIIVIACGTVSSNCYSQLKERYDIKIIDIITPTIDYIRKSNYKSIGVLGTTRTINSHIFKNMLDIDVYEEACSEFVSLIESNRIDLIDVSKHLKNIKADTVILGCTHYPLIRDKIDKNCIDMADNITLDENSGNGSITLYFSYLDDKIRDNVGRILGNNISKVLKID